jgi:hypothetical protein
MARSIALLGAACIIVAPASIAAAVPSRPNIVFILSDDL